MSEAESLKRTKQLLLKWKNDKNIVELKNFYHTKSFSGILGVERREMSHSNFIAWILDDKESHNLSQFAIRQLFDILLEWGEDKINDSLDLYNKNNNMKLEYDNLYKALMLGTYKIEDLNVAVEKAIKDKKRIDIVISMSIESEKENVELPQKVNIIIENKVDSNEHDKQTKTYYEYYSKDEKYKNDLNLFVYLLPISTSKLNDKLAYDEHYININYQLLSDNIFERALTHDISNRVKFMITEYLLSLRKPSRENKGETMATGKLERELLKEFWNEHQELLGTAFKILAEDTDDDEAKKNFENMEKNTKELSTRDNTRYNFNDLTNLPKGKVVLAVVKKYIEDNPETTYEEAKKIFTDKINTGFIVKLEEAKEKERVDRKRHFMKDEEIIRLKDDTEMVVRIGWSLGKENKKDTFDRFLILSKKLGYSVSEYFEKV